MPGEIFREEKMRKRRVYKKTKEEKWGGEGRGREALAKGKRSKRKGRHNTVKTSWGITRFVCNSTIILSLKIYGQEPLGGSLS